MAGPTTSAFAWRELRSDLRALHGEVGQDLERLQIESGVVVVHARQDSGERAIGARSRGGHRQRRPVVVLHPAEAALGGLAAPVVSYTYDGLNRVILVIRVSAQTIYAWIRQDEWREHWEARRRRRGKRPCRRLEKHLGVQLYFADPGCPYQRGTNENTNGLIRRYFPRGTDFRDISHHEVRRVEILLNDRPRACLGFQTPNEVFFEKTPPSGCD